MRILRGLLAAFLLLAAIPAAAEERITSFVSDVSVQKDSSLEVTETIDVVSEGNSIRRGIYRDFPTLYRGPNGSRVRVGFEFRGAQRDGSDEPASVEPLSNGVRIRIGDPDVLIEPGDHRYVIRYRTTRQIGRFPGHDELYWNATGNGWMFPIEVAEARIRLPPRSRSFEAPPTPARKVPQTAMRKWSASSRAKSSFGRTGRSDLTKG
jgi:hypothetical protein